jgi:signal peptidase I
VYVRPFEFSGWHIASKVDPEQNPRWERIQRAVWQPVYHSEYVPLDHGQSPARGERYRWQTPWLPDSDAWSVDGRRDYLFTPVSADQVGTLRFDFRGPGSSIRDYASEAMRYPYNQFGQWTGHHDEPLEDVRIAVTVTPASRQSQVILQAVARWDAGPVPIRARFDAQPNADLWIEQQIDSQWQVIGAGRINGLFSPGRPVTLEFWIVDQTLIAWVDGREIRRVGTHVDFKELLQRPGPVQPYENDIAITVAGGAMTLSDVQLDRDLYYGSERDYSNGGVRGGVPRSIRGSTMLAGFEPVTLADDEFFFLGDNSPHSQDGRQWTSVDPWVRHRYFFDKRDPEGKVPRQLLLGRAFLVYYPAPLPLNPDSWAVVPNLGDIRRID